MAFVAAGAAIAGGVTKAAGDIIGGDAKAKLAEYQAGVARKNAILAQQDAAYTEATAGVEEQQVGYKTADIIGQTRAVYAHGDIDPSRGSAALVVASEKAIGAQEVAGKAANAAKRAFGFQVASAEDIAQAGVYDSTAKYDRIGSYFDATSSILGSVAQVGMMRYSGGPAGSGVFQSGKV